MGIGKETKFFQSFGKGSLGRPKRKYKRMKIRRFRVMDREDGRWVELAQDTAFGIYSSTIKS
jgi:hypothetical protein